MTLLKLENLTSGYSGNKVIENVSLRVEEGSVTLLIGPNGAGKTTLLKTIMHILEPQSGAVYLDGDDLTRLPTRNIVRKGISWVPQGSGVFPMMTVMENLEMGGYSIKDRRLIPERIQNVFELFPILKQRSTQKAGYLSGGERQMLAIGRALTSSPRVLLLDEPSSGLDIGKQELIFARLAEMNKKGLAMLLVEQEVKKALSLAHRVYLMRNGMIKAEGEPKQFSESETLSSAFFGT